MEQHYGGNLASLLLPIYITVGSVEWCFNHYDVVVNDCGLLANHRSTKLHIALTLPWQHLACCVHGYSVTL